MKMFSTPGFVVIKTLVALSLIYNQLALIDAKPTPRAGPNLWNYWDWDKIQQGDENWVPELPFPTVDSPFLKDGSFVPNIKLSEPGTIHTPLEEANEYDY